MTLGTCGFLILFTTGFLTAATLRGGQEKREITQVVEGYARAAAGRDWAAARGYLEGAARANLEGALARQQEPPAAAVEDLSVQVKASSPSWALAELQVRTTQPGSQGPYSDLRLWRVYLLRQEEGWRIYRLEEEPLLPAGRGDARAPEKEMAACRQVITAYIQFTARGDSEAARYYLAGPAADAAAAGAAIAQGKLRFQTGPPDLQVLYYGDGQAVVGATYQVDLGQGPRLARVLFTLARINSNWRITRVEALEGVTEK
ncbi:MAG: hypothetical protein PWP70_34 [Moorella sp. (in: firmicutes)]|nr:hypothetical protein [Moorella sp. (in: firmicutes)]